jgi:hypothetical protein
MFRIKFDNVRLITNDSEFIMDIPFVPRRGDEIEIPVSVLHNCYFEQEPDLYDEEIVLITVKDIRYSVIENRFICNFDFSW